MYNNAPQFFRRTHKSDDYYNTACTEIKYLNV